MYLIATRSVILSAPYIKLDCSYQDAYATMLSSYPVPPCDNYRSMIDSRTRASCHFESKNLPQLDGSWIFQGGPSPSLPQGHYWRTRNSSEDPSFNFPSCEYETKSEPMECNQGTFLPYTSVEYIPDCNVPYHITTPVKQELYHHPANSLFSYGGQLPDGPGSPVFYPPSSGCMGPFPPPVVEGYRSLHQSYSPESQNYYADPPRVGESSPTLYRTELVSPFLLDAFTVESTLSELDPVGVEEELRSLAQASTDDSFEHHEMLSVSSRPSCKEECCQ